MHNSVFIILTPNEVEEIYSFCKLKKQNIVLKSSNCGIGDAKKITTQKEYSNRENKWLNITDYDSW